MKKYHVYGLGNALVDTEIEVTDKDSTSCRLRRIDDSGGRRAPAFPTGAPGRPYGDVPPRLRWFRANTVISLAQFGGRGYFSCKVADDENGRFYMQDLEDHGVDHNAEAQIAKGITGKCLVMITDDAERTMNTFLGSSIDLSSADIDAEAIADSEYLYIEGYLVTGDSARQAAINAATIAREAGTKIALSLSDPGIVEFFREGLEQIVEVGVDLCSAMNRRRSTGARPIILIGHWKNCRTPQKRLQSPRRRGLRGV